MLLFPVAVAKGLVDKGMAYPVNGSVYFRVSKHGKYGSLAGLDRSGMQVRARWGGGRKRTGILEPIDRKGRRGTFHVLAIIGKEACVVHPSTGRRLYSTVR